VKVGAAAAIEAADPGERQKAANARNEE